MLCCGSRQSSAGERQGRILPVQEKSFPPRAFDEETCVGCAARRHGSVVLALAAGDILLFVFSTCRDQKKTNGCCALAGRAVDAGPSLNVPARP